MIPRCEVCGYPKNASALIDCACPKPSAPTDNYAMVDGMRMFAPQPPKDAGRLSHKNTSIGPKDAGAREFWIFPDNIHERDIFEAPMHERWKKYGYVPVRVIEYAAYEELEREQVQHIDLLAKQYEAELTQARAELLTCKGDLACALTDLSEARAELAEANNQWSLIRERLDEERAKSAALVEACRYVLAGLAMWRKYQSPGNIADIEDHCREALAKFKGGK